MLTAGSLFSGAGWLSLAVEQAMGATTRWVSDVEPAANAVLARRFPNAANLGDITAVDWATVEPVDIIEGGSPCFVAGTPVLTRRGLIPIEDVIEGDQVWTREARWRPVTATMTRIAPTVEFRPGFYSTPDHRLWLRKQGRKWNNDRRAYDRVLGDPDWIDAEHSQGHYAATPISVTGVDHGKPETLTWWQIGRFLADGYTNRQVNIYLGGSKLGDAERFPGWKHTQQETALKLTMPRSTAEAVWLSTHFGKGAHGKTLPAFVLALPEEGRREVLEGYWSGDGYAFGKRSMRSASVSPALTVGIQMLAASLGYSTSLHYNRTAPTTVIQGRTVNQRDWWSMTATPDEGRYTERDQDWLWQKLRKQPAQGPLQRVYDLTVADDHSFIAAGIVVHNCQDVSTAGRRAGMTDGTRSNLWVAMREAIRVIEPKFVIWENVAGALSAAAHSDVESCPGCVGDTEHGGPALRALGRVLADLTELGFDAEWVTVRASDVGACHQRARVFVLAWHPERVGVEGHGAEGVEVSAPPAGARVSGRADRGDHGLNLLPTPRTSDTNGAGVHGQGGIDLRTAVAYLPTPTATPYGTQKGLNPGAQYRPSLDTLARDLLPTPRATRGGSSTEIAQLLPTPRASDGSKGDLTVPSVVTQCQHLLPTVRTQNNMNRQSEGYGPNLGGVLPANGTDWGKYGPAIERHAHMLGRPHPSPTITGARGNPKLSAHFTEWMMCAPDGWIGDLVDDGTITNNAGLKLSGNGVVIPQAVHAIRGMLARAFSSMATQPELIESCRDCGDPSPAPICTECAEIAQLFGLTPEQRLTQIGGAA